MNRIARRFEKEYHLLASRRIRLDGLRTVCLAVGPYGNLTTLTAAVLFLHPECQVLNHGSDRVFGDPRLDFIENYADERFETFCRYAVSVSRGGERGNHGGSIVHSHAFDSKHRMDEAFKRASLPLVKKNITSLFWKESLRTTNHMRATGVDPSSLLRRNRRLRFLLPVRDPIDCAISNQRTGKARGFGGISKSSTLEQICEAVLDELLWCRSAQSSFPERFITYFENEPPRAVLLRLAEGLELAPSEEWLSNASAAFAIKPGPQHPEEMLSFYRSRVEAKFERFPDFAERLIDLVQPEHSRA